MSEPQPADPSLCVLFFPRLLVGSRREKNYLEIALDLHSWKYVTRRILMNAPKRFHVLVWDFGLLVQANEKEELPEQILASTRMTHTRISQVRPCPGS